MQYRESQMENSTLTTNKETACDDMSLENHNMDLETTKNRLLLFNDTLQKKKGKRQIMRLVELTFLCQTLKNTKKLIVF